MVRRNTSQKTIVYNAIEHLGHSTIEELIDYIKKNNEKEISLSTIYRTIGILIEDRFVKTVKLLDTDVYETVKEKHHHFVCKKCGYVYDVFIKKAPEIKTDYILEVDDCEIVYSGTCEKCLNNIKN